jgi:histidine triad (HIT) family protein
MDDCVFCNIVNKTFASDILFENDNLIVIRDIMPKAPVHLLVVPKKHIPSINELTSDDAALVADIVLTARDQAKAAGVADNRKLHQQP